jgi:cytochrome c-type biogenesis protein CcmH
LDWFAPGDNDFAMMFWIVAALMTFAACLAVALPYLRAQPSGGALPANDVEVYADQLREVDRDLSRGLIAAGEADEARAELGRRILNIADASQVAPSAGRKGRVIATIALLLVPVVAWGLYGAIGSPALPGEPLQARLDKNPGEATLPELILRAERQLAENPQDARGWVVVAPVYLRIGRTADAVNAYRQAIALSPPSAELQAGLGEALTAAAGGTVTADAVAAFDTALELDPANSKARYFLAGALAQEGRTGEAKAGLAALLDTLEPQSPWRQPVQEALASLDAPASGPGEDDLKAAAELSPDERAAMVENMVEGLARRLGENPADTDGWVRLVRSYHVLGRAEDARNALKNGLAALSGKPSEAERLKAGAASIGVTE